MFKPFVVCKSISLSGVDAEEIRQRSRQFWQARRIKFSHDDEQMMLGKRGNLWANWTSFDQDQIIASLTLLFDEANSVSARMEVNTIGQCMTDWTKAYFFLEMRTFASMLRNEGGLEQEWVYFRSGRFKAAIWYVFCGMLAGNRMSAKERRFFLSADDEVFFDFR